MLAFSRQNELAKYGVPELKDTMAKYLRSVEPFLTQEELAETKKSVEEFLAPGGEGEKLQEILKLRTEEKDNWVKFKSNFECSKLSIRFFHPACRMVAAVCLPRLPQFRGRQLQPRAALPQAGVQQRGGPARLRCQARVGIPGLQANAGQVRPFFAFCTIIHHELP